MTQIGFLGPYGTFSELAAKRWQSENPSFQTVPMPSLFDLFQALTEKEVSTIIVPIENSIEGTVSTAIDLLTKHNDIFIINEILLPVSHALMAKEPMSLTDVKFVMSHPQPLAQCQTYLLKHLPQALTMTAKSTAQAAKDLTDPTTAIIGHQGLSEVYNLVTLDTNINDSKTNVTRFVVLSHNTTPPTGNDKTSIVLSTTHNEPGSLVSILQYFANQSINLTKIESRPTKVSLGHYLFFIDFQGHTDDAEIQSVLKKIQPLSSTYKWLGSYPIDVS